MRPPGCAGFSHAGVEPESGNAWKTETWQKKASTTDHVGTGAPARPVAAQARQTFHRTLRLPVPLLDAKVFLKLLQLDLNANPPGAPIVKIHLSAEPVRPRAAQGGLFLPPIPGAGKARTHLGEDCRHCWPK